MRIFHQYGSRARLFEMMERVNGIRLNESELPQEQREEVVNQFVEFIGKKLDFTDGFSDLKIHLSYDGNMGKEMKSFGKITPGLDEIVVVAANRNLADILRTLAHEIVHYKQYKEGRIDQNSGKTGSDIENEANSLAGIILREFGHQNPIIFE